MASSIKFTCAGKPLMFPCFSYKLVQGVSLQTYRLTETAFIFHTIHSCHYSYNMMNNIQYINLFNGTKFTIMT